MEKEPVINKDKIIAALLLVAETYSKELAMTVESIYRVETTHFTSVNFQRTLSPGMEVRKDKDNKWIAAIPYGWQSLDDYWKKNPQCAPSGTFDQTEATSALATSRGVRRFIVFKNIEAAIMSVAFRLNVKGGDGGAWFATDEEGKAKYREYLKKVTPRFVIDNYKPKNEIV